MKIMNKIILSLLLFVCSFVPANAVLKVDISAGKIKPMPIALPIFGSDSSETKAISKKISNLIQNNLDRSGLFEPLNRKAFINQKVSDKKMPKFKDWRAIGSDALVTGSIIEHGEKIKISFRLWDVFSGKQIAGREFISKRTNWRRIGHVVSDEIYERLSGEKKYFDSKIAFVSESTSRKGRTIKRVAVMDQDGRNVKFISGRRSLVLTPRFSPDGKKVLYISYNRYHQPRVYLRNLYTGTEVKIGNFEGISFGPAFSPDGKHLAMTIANNGKSNIHMVNIKNGAMKQLTSSNAINTSPSFSPDGKKIIFESDRGGSQQLYIMNKSGKKQKRITFGKGSYATPQWSPLGNFIAFTKMRRGVFYIGIMRPDGTDEKILSKGFLVESPSWAPNGRTLIFTKQATRNSQSKLYTVDITGQNELELKTKKPASDPSWSALLPL